MSPPPSQAPKLGKYVLLKKLGGGGMGRVYLASMSGPMAFEKKVVVKTILPSLTEHKDYVQLFLNEARLGARLSHSAIATIHELGEENGLYFLVMEYVDGWTLRQAIKAAEKAGTALNPARVAEIFARACEGLAYAHALADQDGKPLGVVHRDLSPQNIMISREGDVKIIDFGVARSDLSTNQTVAGTIKGKLSYMSPEQSRGERVDARSDIFALGILLYESLTNRNPFDRESPVSILRAIDSFEPPPLQTVRADLGPFDPIIERCLRKEKERRYPDARELRMDLLAVMERARASQRDHLGSWMSGLLDGQAPAPPDAAPKTIVETSDPFRSPRDPGAELPDEAGALESASEQATRLKIASDGTVLQSAATAEVGSGVSHVTGLRKGRSPLLLGALAAAAVIVVAIAFVFATRAPPEPAEPEAPATDQLRAVAAAPAKDRLAPPLAVPSFAVAVAAPQGDLPATPPVAPPRPAKSAPQHRPLTPPSPLAGARGIKRRGAPAADSAAEEAPTIAPVVLAETPAAGGLLIKPVGDTQVLDADGNPLDPHRSMGAIARLQIGNLHVQLKSYLSGGERSLYITSQPWTIVSVDGVSQGKTPLATIPLPDHGVQLELIRPGMASAAVLKISLAGD